MFFYLSKAFWFLVHPGNLLLILLVAGTVLLWTRWNRVGRALLTVAAGFALFIAVVALGDRMTAAVEDRFPAVTELPETVDGIVVLGGVVSPWQSKARGQLAVGGAVERLLAFAELAERYPEARLVFTGGSGDPFHQDLKEAAMIKPLLTRLGVDPGRVLFEDESRNTVENAEFTRDLVQPADSETWILITSAFHMPRAMGCFRKAGWRMIAYPVDYGTTGKAGSLFQFNFTSGLNRMASGLHEWLGLIFYWILGKTDEPFPGPEA